MRTTKVLLLLDVRDLWTNCNIHYGSKVRFDFNKIIKKSKIKHNYKITAFAFVQAIPGKKQDSLIKKLESANITPIIYDNVIDMSKVFNENINYCDIFMLGSGSNSLIDLVKQANYLNKETFIIAPAEGLFKEIANEADDIILLEKTETIPL